MKNNFSIEEIVHAFVSLLEIQVIHNLTFVINCDDIDCGCEGVRYSYPAPSVTKKYLEKLMLSMITEALKTGKKIQLVFSEESENPLGTIAADLSDQLYLVFQNLPELAIYEEYALNGSTFLTFKNAGTLLNGEKAYEIVCSDNILNQL